jgi:phosphoglucomutase
MTDLEKRQEWLDCPAMTEELIAELKKMDEFSLHDSFYRNLTFGTGGLRGVLGAGTNRMNLFTVAKATRGLAGYLKEAFDAPSCAVSFDSRIHSEDFARLTAAVLAEEGVSVWIYPKLQPTPMLSFAVRHLHTSAGIMITASHNPAKYNGYKVYGADGCQITLEAAERTQYYIDAQPDLCGRLPDFDRYLTAGVIRYITEETIEAYYTAIGSLSVKAVTEPLHLVYSPLNGTGNVPVREMMKRMKHIQVEIVAEQEKPDGRFPTCPYPNPEIREAMELAIRKTIETGADFCFATDPDCDRMGAGVRVGSEVKLISGNDMGILMLDFLCRNKKARGVLPPVVVKTIVTTEMASSLCKKHGIELRNVLTGFKFIGEQIGLLEKENAADRFLFGFEESYGYLSGTDVRDKDAVNAALLLCEMASDLKANGKTMLDRLQELRLEYGFFAQRLKTFEYEGEDGAKHMAAIMKALRQPLPAFEQESLRKAGRTDYLLDDTGLPKSDVIEFLMINGDKVVVRPSGTEPKLKAYLFASGKDQLSAEKELDTLEEIVNHLCK